MDHTTTQADKCKAFVCDEKVTVATNLWGLRITQTCILASYIKGDFIEETQLQGLPRYTIEYVYVRVDNQLVLYNKTNTNY